MRKRMTSAFVAVTFALLIGVTVRADDQQIGKQIVDRLQAQRQAVQLEGFNLGVQVESGTVTMSGSVSTEEQAALALDVARRVPGVKLVINDLRVEPAAVETATAAQPASFHGNAAPGSAGGSGGDYGSDRHAPAPSFEPALQHGSGGSLAGPAAHSHGRRPRTRPAGDGPDTADDAAGGRCLRRSNR